MRKLPFYLLLMWSTSLFAQPNCEAFKLNGEIKRYEACKATEEARGHYQFSREYQMAMDKAIAIDPNYDYPYRAKSTAYLKAGNFVEWKKLMDKAVDLNPQQNLGYRAWCRYQFFRDYQGAIEDINLLEELINYDIGHGANGDYHLTYTKALCYKMLEQQEKAIQIIEAFMETEDYWIGIYDYFHLGVLYLEAGRIVEAIEAFKIQEKENILADNQYYLALAYLKKADKELAKINFAKAEELYLNGRILFDGYNAIPDKIYLSDIQEQLSKLN